MTIEVGVWETWTDEFELSTLRRDPVRIAVMRMFSYYDRNCAGFFQIKLYPPIEDLKVIKLYNCTVRFDISRLDERFVGTFKSIDNAKNAVRAILENDISVYGTGGDQ